MSWFAVDDRFHNHRKVLRLRRKPEYPTALALWTLAGSWCTAQEQERFTGVVPLDVLDTFGLPDWFAATEALIEVELWERSDDDHVRFHDWDDWNGIGGKEYRSKEQARLRQQAHRKRKCDAGQHDRHCPAETCSKRNGGSRDAKQTQRTDVRMEAGNAGSRDPGSGRDGPGSGGDGTGAVTGADSQDDPRFWKTSEEMSIHEPDHCQTCEEPTTDHLPGCPVSGAAL